MPLRTRWFCVLEFCVLGFCVLVLLASCAAPPPAMQKAQTPPTDPGLSGTILAVHPVPAASVQQVETLLSGADPQSDAVAGDLSEFIVRTGDGTTISVVQPETADLHPGEQVRIETGGSPHISVPVIH
ncbi:MAG TPA: hypothetical protein VMB73_21210 [Acetobacteraceae bacterium]|nr:hypothetical protein [Acetobacteraceae bacterium]